MPFAFCPFNVSRRLRLLATHIFSSHSFFLRINVTRFSLSDCMSRRGNVATSHRFDLVRVLMTNCLSDHDEVCGSSALCGIIKARLCRSAAGRRQTAQQFWKHHKIHYRSLANADSDGPYCYCFRTPKSSSTSD